MAVRAVAKAARLKLSPDPEAEARIGLSGDALLKGVLAGEGLKPRLKLSPVNSNLGNCILRDAQFPYVTTATVTSRRAPHPLQGGR